VRRLSTPLVVGGSLLLLASLYLPWQRWVRPQLSGSFSGWALEIGSCAAVLAVVVATAGIARWRRSNLLRAVPLAGAALGLAYLGIALAIELNRLDSFWPPAYELHAAYGTFVGIAASGVLLVGALLAVGGMPLTARRIGIVAATSTLLVALLLPWGRVDADLVAKGQPTPDYQGILLTSGLLAALLACLAAARRAPSFPLAAGALLFGAATFSQMTYPFHRAYGAWLGLAASVGLVAASLPVRLPRGLSRYATATCLAGAAFIVSLFLPWQEQCYSKRLSEPALSGECFTTNGWSRATSTAAVLALVLVFSLVLAWRNVSQAALVLAIALLVAQRGANLATSFEFSPVHWRYGAIVGFTAVAALMVALVARPKTGEWSRVSLALVPMGLSIGYAVFTAIHWEFDVDFTDPTGDVLPTLAALLALQLACSWGTRVTTGRPQPLVLIPLAMLTLLVLDLIRLRRLVAHLSWEFWMAVALSLLLLLIGWVEQRIRNERQVVPELLRVDRL
jgi:hypothetical protein